jgi:hypothetical protein
LIEAAGQSGFDEGSRLAERLAGCEGFRSGGKIRLLESKPIQFNPIRLKRRSSNGGRARIPRRRSDH